MSSSCSCQNPLVPQIVKVIDIIEETPDVKNFYVATESGLPFRRRPGNAAWFPLPIGQGCSPSPGRPKTTWSLPLEGRAPDGRPARD